MSHTKKTFLSTGLARFNAHPADILSDVVFAAKLLEFFKAPQVIELLRLLFNSPGRADGDTAVARITEIIQWFVDLQRQVGKDGDKPDPPPELWMNEQIVSAEPPEARRVGQ